MKIVCLCPTYGRPAHLIENTIKCFKSQTAVNQSVLFIFDDLGNLRLSNQPHPGVIPVSVSKRCSSLPQKYNVMLRMLKEMRQDYDAVAVWDDDDIYLPQHLEWSAKELLHCDVVKPSMVYSTYIKPIMTEQAAGRFHGSLVVRRDLLERLGGWLETDSALFDQYMISNCISASSTGVGDPIKHGPPRYIFRWGDTGAAHSQYVMGNQNGWYQDVKVDNTSQIVALKDGYDEAARNLFRDWPNLLTGLPIGFETTIR